MCGSCRTPVSVYMSPVSRTEPHIPVISEDPVPSCLTECFTPDKLVAMSVELFSSTSLQLYGLQADFRLLALSPCELCFKRLHLKRGELSTSPVGYLERPVM